MSTVLIEFTPAGEAAIAAALLQGGLIEGAPESKIGALFEGVLGPGTVRTVEIVKEPFPYVPTNAGDSLIITGIRPLRPRQPGQ